MLLLGLLLALPACGPAGPRLEHAADTQREPPKRGTVVRRTRVVRRVVPAPRNHQPVPTSEVPTPVTLDGEVPWATVRARLAAAAQRGAGRIVLEEQGGASARRVTWNPPGATKRTVRPDLRLAVLLLVREGERCLDVTIHGSAWAARFGCDAPTAQRVLGWGEEARPRFGRLLDDAIRAADSDPARIAVAFDVSSTVESAVVWSDLYPLAEEAILCDAGTVSLVPPGRRMRRSMSAPETSLTWLATHQAPDGRWSASGFGAWCDGRPMQVFADDGAGHAAYDVGATGLALLAFLGAGYTNRGRHPFAKTVGRGLRYLKTCQQSDGCFADPSLPWCAEQHAIAALALLEVYGMTGSPIYARAAQHGLDALPRAVGSATRHGLPALAFTASALASAGLVNEDARQRGREIPLGWDLVFADEIDTACQVASASDHSEEAAVGLFGRILLGGEPARSDALWAAAETVGRRPPTAEHEVDAVHWLFGTLALFQVGGPAWKRWNAQLKGAVVSTQRRDGAFCCYLGSWDPVGRGAGRFGRVGATALRALCLEVYYRYDKVFGTP